MPSGKRESPAWKDPRDIFKRHLKRKSSSRRLLPVISSSPALLQSEISTQSQPPLRCATRSTTRFANPFKRRSPRKRPFRELNSVVRRNTDDAQLRWDSEETCHGFSSPSVFERMNEEEGSNKHIRSAIFDSKISDIYPVDFSNLTASCSSTPKSALTKLEDLEKTTSATLPIDLRLGFKLRIESKKPFPWMSNPDLPGKYPLRISGLEHDAAIRMYCCVENDSLKQCAIGSANENYVHEELSPLAHLQAATLYWQYPNIAWMHMFPRIDGSQKFSRSRDAQTPTLQSLGSGLVAALIEQWTQAFEQLFHSWRKGSRRLFYLCCSSFTALFMKTPREAPTEIDDDSTCSSWRIAGDYFQVIVTPTTLGFREQLRSEGISFTMRSRVSGSRRSSKESASAFGQDLSEHTNTNERSESQPVFTISDKKSTKEQTPLDFADMSKEIDEGESPNKLNGSDDSDNMTWLKEIGMSPASTRRLTKHLSMSSMSVRSAGNSESESFSSNMPFGDDSGKSTVIISEPSSIQAFFNLVNTSKICHPIIGPHAGLPPTLLSTKPFLHSALCTLNKSSQIVKKAGNEIIYVCEFDNGPIMPHMLSLMCDFLSSCPTINVSDNNVTVYVGGRASCQGMNQAIASKDFADFNKFLYKFSEG
uniref:Uncharacterized protein n=2 Tax=Parascaris univalens TaxID=6257 RepID=A0A915BU04_PARUN